MMKCRKKRIRTIYTYDYDYDYDCESAPDYVDMFADSDSLFDKLTDDILSLEILPRVHDSRTAVRCGAVCKRWRSLVSAPEFVPNFTRHHRQRSFTMLMDFRFQKPTTFEHCLSAWTLVVTGSTIVPTVAVHDRRCYNGFTLRATCDEFILLAEELGSRELCVLNSVTGESLTLVLGENNGACLALARSADKFRIVDIQLRCRDPRQHYSTVFSSETGRWSKLALAPGMGQHTDVVALDGLLYWLYYDNDFVQRMVIFDAFREWWAYVPLPADLVFDSDFYHGQAVEFSSPREVVQLGSSKYRLHIGAVQGKIRLAQLFRAGGVDYVLKIWEFNGYVNNQKWRLISDHKLVLVPRERTEWIYFFSFDADCCDSVYLCCDRTVYCYRMLGRKCKYMRVLWLYCKDDDEESVDRVLPRFAHVNIVRHPPWHTSLHTLPSAPMS